MTTETMKAEIAKLNYNALLADGFDDALVGYGWINDVWVALYDSEKCIEILQERDGVEYLEAADNFAYNVEGSYYGRNTPYFIEVRDDKD
jgi:hypothetical protein